MTLLESVNALFSFAAEFKNAGYTKLCMDVYSSAIETLRALGKSEEENRALKRRVWELEDELEAYKRGDAVSSADVVYHEDGAYITVKGRGGAKFCENCWSLRRELVRIDFMEGCPVCGTRIL